MNDRAKFDDPHLESLLPKVPFTRRASSPRASHRGSRSRPDRSLRKPRSSRRPTVWTWAPPRSGFRRRPAGLLCGAEEGGQVRDRHRDPGSFRHARIPEGYLPAPRQGRLLRINTSIRSSASATSQDRRYQGSDRQGEHPCRRADVVGTWMRWSPSSRISPRPTPRSSASRHVPRRAHVWMYTAHNNKITGGSVPGTAVSIRTRLRNRSRRSMSRTN